MSAIFNFSLIMRNSPQTTTFEDRGEPERNQTEVLPFSYKPNERLPLGQAGSLPNQSQLSCLKNKIK